MKWIKKGRIFDPTGISDTVFNYAQNPNVLVLEDRLRVYFTCRPKRASDGSFVSHTSFVDLDRNNFSKALYVHGRPVMNLGCTGEFDEFGIMPGSVVQMPDKNEVWLYYVGWTRMVSVPYNWTVGLAVSTDGGHSFSRVGRGPILAATHREPYLQACPRVWRRASNDWWMWYQSGLAWNDDNGHKESVYVTMFATSTDGIHWQRPGRQVIPSKVPQECQTSASVFVRDDCYHMYFSYRHGIGFRNAEKGYRIGYARSNDGLSWERHDDDGGLDVSSEGWDSEMVCYPHVVDIDGGLHMFYCGNAFGRDGFGYATLAE